MENDPANQPPFKPNSHNSNYRAKRAAAGGLVTNTESPASDKAAHGKNKAEAIKNKSLAHNRFVFGRFCTQRLVHEIEILVKVRNLMLASVAELCLFVL